MTRIDGVLNVSDQNDDWTFSADDVIRALTAGPSHGDLPAQTNMMATYQTNSVSPTVHFTATFTDGTILTARTTSGITIQQGFYTVDQDITSVHNGAYIAIWDEGDANDYVREWIVIAQ